MNKQKGAFFSRLMDIFEASAYHRVARELQLMSDDELRMAGLSREQLIHGQFGSTVANQLKP